MLLQLLIVAVLMTAIGISFGLNVLAPRNIEGVPEELGGMKLASFTDGEQALAQISQLHGTSIELVNAYIASYSHDFNPYHNDDSQVTVWAGKTGNKDEAVKLTERMSEAIKRGDSPFSNLQQLTLDGHEVFQVTGPSGEHFFYVSPKTDMVIWLTIKAPTARYILQESFENF
ncbi:MAG: hypothetical protein Q8O55_05480 [Dehalococcoidales bacterium]|nr:hypothetical protein [Dehalococcoidales bacterium]